MLLLEEQRRRVKALRLLSWLMRCANAGERELSECPGHTDLDCMQPACQVLFQDSQAWILEYLGGMI